MTQISLINADKKRFISLNLRHLRHLRAILLYEVALIALRARVPIPPARARMERLWSLTAQG